MLFSIKTLTGCSDGDEEGFVARLAVQEAILVAWLSDVILATIGSALRFKAQSS